jgi:two-component system chemotaxis response regulator CheB
MRKHFLQPGELIFCSDETEVTTILGSCVAVCLWDRELQVGGMCHYYLAVDGGSGSPKNNYGEFAIPNLLREFKQHGSHPKNMVAKILGGGHVIDFKSEAHEDVGKVNISIAKEILKKFSIPVVGENIGGLRGRKVVMNTMDGSIKFQLIKKKEEITEADKVRVLIVDDSKAIRLILRKMIERDPELEIVGEAENAEQAWEFIESKKADVITLDINMPGKNGLELLADYMPNYGTPTIMIAALNESESDQVLHALELGAFDFIKKPSFNDIEALTIDLHNTLKEASKSKKRGKITFGKGSIKPQLNTLLDKHLRENIVLIGSSTGGTVALRDLFTSLPETIPPMVVVQHIPPVFSREFANRMDELCPFTVSELSDDTRVEPNNIYIAPGGKQIRLVERGESIKVEVTDDPPVNRFKPSVDYMFDSAASIKSRKITAVLLTGMGDDGARGMLRLKEKGAHTIAQDEATSVVYGMPKAAKEMKAVSEIRPLQEIPQAILQAVQKRKAA